MKNIFLITLSALVLYPVAFAGTIELRTYQSSNIVVASSMDRKFPEPHVTIFEAKARVACEILGYTFAGEYKKAKVHDQLERGPVEVHELQEDGKFKKKNANIVYSLYSVMCEVDDKLECKSDHFGEKDIKYIQLNRESCQ